ncbi:MAG TPA: site-specific integrase [Bacteroidales bacterium]|nr:site-specific integrase [Bacteroidales bacterium]
MEKRSTFSVYFYLKKHRTNSEGEIPIYLRISVNSLRAEMSMHLSIEEKLWNTNSGRAIGTSKKIKDINSFLESARSTMFEHYKYLRETGKPISAVAIKNSYLGIVEEEDKGKKVLELFQEHNDRVKTLINIDYSPETVERYETSLKHTRDFIKQKYNRDDLYLSELDHEFITYYEIYFKTVRKCAHNTTMKYIKNFKKIVRLAITNGHLDRDPFANFKMRLRKVDRGFLSEDELKILINKKFNTTRLEQVRDCFLFSCFTGLAHSDLKRLSREHVVTGTDGGQWIKINRKKTDNLSSIPILEVSQKILDKYKNDAYCMANNVLLPVNSNQKMNAYLKEIADVCEINKNFSSHLARHTFATTVTLNNNVPIETVSKMLGHSSINMTKIYARLLDKKVGQDMQHLNNKFSLAEV